MNAHEAQQLTILVVDDDLATLRLITKIVSSGGYHVLQAQNGLEACSVILQESPDLVVCDWNMPEMDGVELCREIRQMDLSQYVYFLLLTGKSNTGDIVDGLAAGADDFMTKPIDRAVLLARLEAGARVLHMERQLRTVSQYDPMTGVMNRRAFHERFEQEWKRAERYGHPISCVMIDIDFFKRINDTHGHLVGDATLIEFASLLKNQCRPSDVLCRYGGEEFCVLLTETNEAGAARWAERVRLATSNTPITTAGVKFRITASLGVAERLEDCIIPEKLIEMADQGLAVAKQSGRNRAVTFSSLNEAFYESCNNLAIDDPLADVVASDVMSVVIVCPNQNDTIRHVIEQFIQLRLNSAPVVDDTGKLVGIVAESDLLTHAIKAEGWENKITDVMRTDVVCYEENTPASEVFQFLSRVSIPRVVIVNDGHPTGVISRGTLLRWFSNYVATCERKEPEILDSCRRQQIAYRREGVVKTAKAIKERADYLCSNAAAQETFSVPCVVGEATKIQSLVNDLLGYARKVNIP